MGEKEKIPTKNQPQVVTYTYEQTRDLAWIFRHHMGNSKYISLSCLIKMDFFSLISSGLGIHHLGVGLFCNHFS